MKIILLIACDREGVELLDQIASSIGMVLHNESTPLELESIAMYVGTIDNENLRDVPLLWTKARQTIAEINGAALFQDNRWKSIELINIRYENPLGQLEWVPITGSMMATLSGVGSRNPTGAELIKLAQVDEPLAKVLRLTAKEMDWSNL